MLALLPPALQHAIISPADMSGEVAAKPSPTLSYTCSQDVASAALLANMRLCALPPVIGACGAQRGGKERESITKTRRPARMIEPYSKCQ